MSLERLCQALEEGLRRRRRECQDLLNQKIDSKATVRPSGGHDAEGGDRLLV